MERCGQPFEDLHVVDAVKAFFPQVNSGYVFQFLIISWFLKWDTEIEITVRYRYAASIGRLVWAFTKWETDREEAFDWGR